VTRFRIILTVVCLTLAGGLAWAAFKAPRPQGATVSSYGKADVGGPFRMVDQNGRPVNESLLEGKWSAVFFGFTYCPDVCPTTLQSLAAAKERLGRKGENLQFVFVSVDPERDTPEKLKAYLDSDAFPKGVVGLTGTPEQVAATAKAYRVWFQKEGEGADYLVNHSGYVYLMNPKGEFSRILSAELAPDELAEQVQKAMREES